MRRWRCCCCAWDISEKRRSGGRAVSVAFVIYAVDLPAHVRASGLDCSVLLIVRYAPANTHSRLSYLAVLGGVLYSKELCYCTSLCGALASFSPKCSWVRCSNLSAHVASILLDGIQRGVGSLEGPLFCPPKFRRCDLRLSPRMGGRVSCVSKGLLRRIRILVLPLEQYRGPAFPPDVFCCPSLPPPPAALDSKLLGIVVSFCSGGVGNTEAIRKPHNDRWALTSWLALRNGSLVKVSRSSAPLSVPLSRLVFAFILLDLRSLPTSVHICGPVHEIVCPTCRERQFSWNLGVPPTPCSVFAYETPCGVSCQIGSGVLFELCFRLALVV
eukprot:RCo029868